MDPDLQALLDEVHEWEEDSNPEEWDAELPEFPDEMKIKTHPHVEMTLEDLTPWLERDDFVPFTSEDLGGWPTETLTKREVQYPIGAPKTAEYIQQISKAIDKFFVFQDEYLGPHWTKFNPEKMDPIQSQYEVIKKEIDLCTEAFHRLTEKYSAQDQHILDGLAHLSNYIRKLIRLVNDYSHELFENAHAIRAKQVKSVFETTVHEDWEAELTQFLESSSPPAHAFGKSRKSKQTFDQWVTQTLVPFLFESHKEPSDLEEKAWLASPIGTKIIERWDITSEIMPVLRKEYDTMFHKKRAVEVKKHHAQPIEQVIAKTQQRILMQPTASAVSTKIKSELQALKRILSPTDFALAKTKLEDAKAERLEKMRRESIQLGQKQKALFQDAHYNLNRLVREIELSQSKRDQAEKFIEQESQAFIALHKNKRTFTRDHAENMLIEENKKYIIAFDRLTSTIANIKKVVPRTQDLLEFIISKGAAQINALHKDLITTGYGRIKDDDLRVFRSIFFKVSTLYLQLTSIHERAQKNTKDENITRHVQHAKEYIQELKTVEQSLRRLDVHIPPNLIVQQLTFLEKDLSVVQPQLRTYEMNQSLKGLSTYEYEPLTPAQFPKEEEDSDSDMEPQITRMKRADHALQSATIAHPSPKKKRNRTWKSTKKKPFRKPEHILKQVQKIIAPIKHRKQLKIPPVFRKHFFEYRTIQEKKAREVETTPVKKLRRRESSFLAELKKLRSSSPKVRLLNEKVPNVVDEDLRSNLAKKFVAKKSPIVAKKKSRGPAWKDSSSDEKAQTPIPPSTTGFTKPPKSSIFPAIHVPAPAGPRLSYLKKLMPHMFRRKALKPMKEHHDDLRGYKPKKYDKERRSLGDYITVLTSPHRFEFIVARGVDRTSVRELATKIYLHIRGLSKDVDISLLEKGKKHTLLAKDRLHNITFTQLLSFLNKFLSGSRSRHLILHQFNARGGLLHSEAVHERLFREHFTF